MPNQSGVSSQRASVPRVLVTTVPFGAFDPTPLSMLAEHDVDVVINPLGRKLRAEELAEMAKDVDVIIAGTEPITEAVMENAPRLRLISRVGVGLDSVDLRAARERGIQVAYTPEAPAPAVAELTIGLMLALLRNTHRANSEMHQGTWQRHTGRRIAHSTIGVIGAGRIGRRVLALLNGVGAGTVLVNDITAEPGLDADFGFSWASKERIYREADVVTLHVPLTATTLGMIGIEEFRRMRDDALLVNTARGGIVNEAALVEALSTGLIAGAAVDVFEAEPYSGPLAELDTCLLTAHMGSMSADCRARMEIEATADALRFLDGLPLTSPVPASEYPA